MVIDSVKKILTFHKLKVRSSIVFQIPLLHQVYIKLNYEREKLFQILTKDIYERPLQRPQYTSDRSSKPAIRCQVNSLHTPNTVSKPSCQPSLLCSIHPFIQTSGHPVNQPSIHLAIHSTSQTVSQPICYPSIETRPRECHLTASVLNYSAFGDL